MKRLTPVLQAKNGVRNAVDFIEQLYNELITDSCQASPLLYCPDGSSTSGQMAVFIVKTFNLL